MPTIDGRYYKTAIISPHKAIGVEIAPLIAQGLPLAPTQTIKEYPHRRQLLDLLKSFEPKVVFLDCATDFQMALSVLSDLQALNPAIAVVGLLLNDNTDTILSILRQGAIDFMARPFRTDHMDAVVEKIARMLPAPTQRSGNCTTIAVLPAKGACGATTVACNLAFQAKRIGVKKVLLADFDPLTGTISFLLKIKNSYSFLEALTRQNTLDGELWKQMVTASNGVDVMLAPDNPMDGLDSLQNSSPILQFAQALYDLIIVDAGDAYSDWSLSVVRNSDEVLLVTTNEIAALQSAQRALNHLQANHIPASRVRVVVNRYDKDLGLRSDSIAQVLEAEVAQVIPADYDAIQKSLIEGKPVATGTSFSKSLAGLSEKLGITASPKGDEEKKSTSILGKFGFLSRPN
ncbi:MAG TPA: AAA family ATPase [Bryobacteraceae bacterium]|jgi:pilus assembly protein CpaE|nr:AAA family ATPase [Bryobacteraceae bacterium]